MEALARIFRRPDSRQDDPFVWTVQARFTVFGHQLREIDLTPAIGLMFLVAVIVITARNSW